MPTAKVRGITFTSNVPILKNPLQKHVTQLIVLKPNTSRENGSFYLTYPDNRSLDRGQFPHPDIHSGSNRNQSSLSGKGESHEN